MRKIKLKIQAADENGEMSDPVEVEMVWHSHPIIDGFVITPRVPVLGMPVGLAVASHHPDGTEYIIVVTSDDPSVEIAEGNVKGTFEVVAK